MTQKHPAGNVSRAKKRGNTTAILAGTDFENELTGHGHRLIAGVDEAGRGPLAGPVSVAAVILDLNNIPAGLADSKILSAAQRARIYVDIINKAVAVGVSLAPAQEIDRINIRQATLRAMTSSVDALAERPDFVLIDGRDVPGTLTIPARAIIKGDSRSVSIAAASIIAKVTRDRLMTRLAADYPDYGFDRHMGYPTQFHRDQLGLIGPTPFHRYSFAPLTKFRK